MLKKVAFYPYFRFKRSLLNQYTADTLRNLRELLVEDPVVNVKEFGGSFCVGRESDLFKRLVIRGSYESDIVDSCRRFIDQDKDAIDVGANIGFYTVMLAKTSFKGKVLAIEPTKDALTRLYKNIELNNVSSNVIVFEGVASDETGTCELNVIPGKEEYSSMASELVHPSISGKESVSNSVASTTIDELVEKYAMNPGFMKVDVEGAEHLVFGGAQKTLNEHRPVILSELDDDLLKKNGCSSSQVLDQLKKFDYKFVDPAMPSIPIKDIDKCKYILCVPA